MNTYLVVTPEMYDIEPICDDGSGPKEYFRIAEYVQANTKKEAIWKAVKMKEFSRYVDQQRADGCCPFTGIRAELA